MFVFLVYFFTPAIDSWLFRSQAKRALAEQLHISQELTKKTLVESEDEEQEALDDKDVVDDITTGQFAGLVTSEDNPWSLDTKGDSKLEASSSSRDLGQCYSFLLFDL